MRKKFTVLSIEPLFSRVNYKCDNPRGESIRYCLRDDGHEGIHLYRQSRDGEPQAKVELKGKQTRAELFQRPGQATILCRKVIEWINS